MVKSSVRDSFGERASTESSRADVEPVDSPAPRMKSPVNEPTSPNPVRMTGRANHDATRNARPMTAKSRVRLVGGRCLERGVGPAEGGDPDVSSSNRESVDSGRAEATSSRMLPALSSTYCMFQGGLQMLPPLHLKIFSAVFCPLWTYKSKKSDWNYKSGFKNSLKINRLDHLKIKKRKGHLLCVIKQARAKVFHCRVREHGCHSGRGAEPACHAIGGKDVCSR